jgi:hypothetical protein
MRQLIVMSYPILYSSSYNYRTPYSPRHWQPLNLLGRSRCVLNLWIWNSLIVHNQSNFGIPFRDRQIQCTPSYLTHETSFIILSFHNRLGLGGFFIHSNSSKNILQEFFMAFIWATCPTFPSLFQFTALILSRTKYCCPSQNHEGEGGIAPLILKFDTNLCFTTPLFYLLVAIK